MSFLELAKKRYSCRSLSDKEVEQEKIDKILEAAIVAPTAKNIQPFKIWVMKSEEAVKSIYDVTHCTFNSKLFLVVGAAREGAFVRPFDNASFTHVDASIVSTHIMMEIEDLGLSTTWVGYFDAPKLQTIYPEMKPYDLVAIFPIGYAADDAKPSDRHEQRKSAEELVVEL